MMLSEECDERLQRWECGPHLVFIPTVCHLNCNPRVRLELDELSLDTILSALLAPSWPALC